MMLVKKKSIIYNYKIVGNKVISCNNINLLKFMIVFYFIVLYTYTVLIGILK